MTRFTMNNLYSLEYYLLSLYLEETLIVLRTDRCERVGNTGIGFSG
jgi:hypothetical protein